MQRLNPLTKAVLTVALGVYWVLTVILLGIHGPAKSGHGDAAAGIFLLPLIFIMVLLLLTVIGGVLHDHFVSLDKSYKQKIHEL